MVLCGDFEKGSYPFAFWAWGADIREEFGMPGILYGVFAVCAWWWGWVGLGLGKAGG
jgi:hypothetical protein